MITAIIEKNENNFFMVSSNDEVCDCFFSGYGASVQEAKDDFMKSIQEMRELSIEEGKDFPDNIEVVFNYDIPSFFNFFDFINISKFAERAGINSSKMRQYKSGMCCASEQTTKKILETAHALGLELQKIEFS